MSFQPTYDALTHIHLKAVPFTQVSLAFGSLTSSYQAIGGKAFATPMIFVVIVSTFNDTVQWSWDG